jgi:N utilization substance protein B
MVVLQILFEDDLNPARDRADSELFVRRRLRHFPEAAEFALSLLGGVRRNRPKLDELLAEKAQNWSLGRMAVTDRNILRLGAYEILYGGTPGPVAINEAVELAKRFGTANSGQFVNGILDRVLREYETQRTAPAANQT